jgi:N-acetyl-alpha-D-muramate 1-phosphate uridylyltransferase
MKAMILAAGKGTRLRPFTENLPKALVPVNGIPILEHSINKLKSFGVDQVIINTHYLGQQVIDFVRSKNNFGIRIEISVEEGELLDTGGGLKKAGWFFDDGQPFVLYNADILTDLDISDMCSFHKTSGALATLFMQDRPSSRKLQFNAQGQLIGWLDKRTGEKKTAKHDTIAHELAFSCVHVIGPNIIPLMQEEGAFSIIDLYLRLAKTKKINSYNPQNTKFLDIGTPEQLQKASAFFEK